MINFKVCWNSKGRDGRAYDYDKYRTLVRGKGIHPVIARRGTEHGSGLGIYRWVVEHAFALLHWFRRPRSRGVKQARVLETSPPACHSGTVVDLNTVVRDLRDEGTEVEALVADLAAEQWTILTPAPGWTIAHQVAHLAWTDQQALLAATDADAFAAQLAELASGPTDRVVDDAAATGAKTPPTKLLHQWRTGRTQLAEALAEIPNGEKLPWYGPPMSATSMATARLMETWAHGLDIADAQGVTRKPTARLRHVAHIGVRTRDWAFLVRQTPPPVEQFRIELIAPDGEQWTWGPADAAQRVAGPALDFCLLTTQRIHRDDTALTTTGSDADRWLDIAQAFAGPPGTGRPRR